jgi:hypothetical protein
MIFALFIATLGDLCWVELCKSFFFLFVVCVCMCVLFWEQVLVRVICCLQDKSVLHIWMSSMVTAKC